MLLLLISLALIGISAGTVVYLFSNSFSEELKRWHNLIPHNFVTIYLINGLLSGDPCAGLSRPTVLVSRPEGQDYFAVQLGGDRSAVQQWSVSVCLYMSLLLFIRIYY